MSGTIQARVLIDGAAEGEVVFTGEPLSFWGGYNARTGEIIDRRHELYGAPVAGKVLVLPGGRGSSTGSGILLEAIRRGTSPAAIILAQPDQILALGAIVARELYDKSIPLVVVSPADYPRLRGARWASIEPAGRISWRGEDGT